MALAPIKRALEVSDDEQTGEQMKCVIDGDSGEHFRPAATPALSYARSGTLNICCFYFETLTENVTSTKGLKSDYSNKVQRLTHSTTESDGAIGALSALDEHNEVIICL